MSAEVHLVQQWHRDGYDVIVVERRGDRRGWIDSEGDWHEITELGTVSDPQPRTFFIRSDHLDALLREGLKIAAPDQAVQHHLADAIDVRDRLLTLVEGVHPRIPA